ncbi:hypothetical protein ERD78_06155 [Allopusillimonas soli]|uniref:Sulfotransferase family 2 domain-containing protein n=1 Tax=Allopusillimonas soli TaxID=659016 RepID=A0A853FC47_9BURK|nr:sulfotransferase family 2 domain-containing protein [Allopusillimonas soli]NYT36450.1 sulfotransferase family 2 domain-containing protein [Allopusillimonas soli]TEA74959.1 hypothetical protein ERD78_06155 [Allopusillimonas soli]
MIEPRILYFVHVPKTAGTSFRVAAEKAYGSESIACDYGLQSGKTHVDIKGLACNNDLFALLSKFQNSKIRMIAGHVPVSKYLPIIPAENIITFVRHPLSQIISHFEHHRRHNKKFNKNFFDYIKSPEANNFQSRLLAGIPLETIGLLGVTERYSESLAVLNRKFGTDFLEYYENKKPLEKNLNLCLDNDIIQAILDANKEDIRLLKRANELLDIRLEMERNGSPFVHGKLLNITTRSLRGFAYYGCNSEPVEVQCLVNGTLYGKPVRATQFRPLLLSARPPRRGCVGFDIEFKPLLKPGDTVVCKVVGSNQTIFSHNIEGEA